MRKYRMQGDSEIFLFMCAYCNIFDRFIEHELIMVVSVIVQFLIVIFISTLLYGVTLWAVRCPNIISGFRWGNTPEEVEQDRQWLRRFYRVMTRTALVILLGGVVSIALKSMLLYVLFLCVRGFCRAFVPRPFVASTEGGHGPDVKRSIGESSFPSFCCLCGAGGAFLLQRIWRSCSHPMIWR